MDMSLLKHLERVQVISVIEKAALFGGDIWQTIPGNPERQLLRIIQIQNDLKTDKVIFRAHTLVNIDPGLPIFIRLSYRNLIFKVEPGHFKISGDRITCDYPEEARALEERNGDRYVLPFDAQVSLSVRRVEKSTKELTYDMELRIIDVSQKGFGILISSRNRDYFQKHDHFWLKAIDQRPLSSPILGSVCYVAPKGYYLKKGDVRVGLSLKSELAPDVFNDLKRKCRIVLSA